MLAEKCWDIGDHGVREEDGCQKFTHLGNDHKNACKLTVCN